MLFGKFPFFAEDQHSMLVLFKNNRGLEIPMDRKITRSCEKLLMNLLTFDRKERINLTSELWDEWHTDIE